MALALQALTVASQGEARHPVLRAVFNLAMKVNQAAAQDDLALEAEF